MISVVEDSRKKVGVIIDSALDLARYLVKNIEKIFSREKIVEPFYQSVHNIKFCPVFSWLHCKDHFMTVFLVK